MGTGQVTLRFKSITRAEWDLFKARIRTFLNNNPNAEALQPRYVEEDPP